MIRKLLIATAIIAAVVSTGCSDTTAPKQPVSGLAAGSMSNQEGDRGHSKRRSGALHIAKECSAYMGLAGDYCTIIRSNARKIPIGSRVYYLAAADLEHGTYDGDVELRVSEGNVAFGHVTVTDLFSTIPNTDIGTGAFSDGTGEFKGFRAQIVISVDANPLLADWDGSYSLSRRDGDEDGRELRSGVLHVTKECSQYTRLAGGFCTITSSNLEAIPAGTTIVYAVASGPTVLNSDVVLVPPGSGRSTAFGHVVLDLASGRGVITLAGGTGKFKRFRASVIVSRLVRPNWAWDGTYTFSSHD